MINRVSVLIGLVLSLIVSLAIVDVKMYYITKDIISVGDRMDVLSDRIDAYLKSKSKDNA